jgi:hypothetical protein
MHISFARYGRFATTLFSKQSVNRYVIAYFRLRVATCSASRNPLVLLYCAGNAKTLKLR